VADHRLDVDLDDDPSFHNPDETFTDGSQIPRPSEDNLFEFFKHSLITTTMVKHGAPEDALFEAAANSARALNKCVAEIWAKSGKLAHEELEELRKALGL